MKKFLSIFIFLSFVAMVNAQTRAIDNLRAEQRRTVRNLETTSRLLEENKQTTTASLSRLNLLNEQISDRQLLISQINRELRYIDNEITTTRQEIEKRQLQLESLKKEYAELIYRTHLRSNSHDRLMFILSAQTLGQSYRRLRYLREFSSFRKAQGREIESMTVELNNQLSSLEKRRVDRRLALQRRETESTRLAQEKSSQQIVISDLRKQEGDLRNRLRTQQQQADNLNNRIARLIAEEEERARERARREAQQRGVAAPREIPLTREEQLIAGNFERNRGKLPWPVERGIIIGKFGRQPHPALPHVTVDNKGIYIQTVAGADARSVFEGVVTQRFSVPGNNNAVIIRHGNYRTVYSNLTDIYVRVGDKVTAKQRIGRVFTDPEDGNKTTLYFMVWKERDLLNPELWITR